MTYAKVLTVMQNIGKTSPVAKEIRCGDSDDRDFIGA